ncbi:MAG: PKD domain-containing protein [Bacteroidota bacterium]|nr:PKD domain-containing protein [Bacteroidota bacterium]
MNLKTLTLLFVILTFSYPAKSQNDSIFKIFQFPANSIPRIDGNTDDWADFPDSYTITNKHFTDDTKKHPLMDTSNLSVKIKVAWVKGLNRLYFLYEASDNYWDFSRTDLHHDILELIVDGDRSGGPLIDRFHPFKGQIPDWEAYHSFHGVHAQNYHIYTPAEGQDWCLAWGAQPWIKEMPYANVAYKYNFRPGQSGKLIMEFWITPFDYAGAEGPQRAVESLLFENKIIGLGFAIIDFDDVNASENNGFWNIAKEHKMYGNASFLPPFRLMPLENRYKKPIEAKWDFKIIDTEKRIVAFLDKSEGIINAWKWDFGDGTVSNEENPIHTYIKGGQYIVTLWTEGPGGTSRMAKVWDVTLK